MHRKLPRIAVVKANDCHTGGPLRLSDFLHRKPVTVLPETRIAEALVVMAESRIGSVIVVDPADQRPVGIFTLRDVLCRVTIPGLDQGQPILAVMTTAPVAVRQSVTVSQAAREMARRELRHLLVTDPAGALVGIVSRTDIYQWMCDSCVSIRRAKAVTAAV